jgi:symplekin
MQYTSLEAEGQGLLDRLLDIIHGDHRSDSVAVHVSVDLTWNSDALLVTSVLNSLGMLMQRRPPVANKILASVLNSNPLKLANSPMTATNQVIMKSIVRTTRALLVNFIKRYVFLKLLLALTHSPRNPENPQNGRIHQYVERVRRTYEDIFSENNRKRPAPVEPSDGLDPSKRQRLGAQPPTAGPSIAPNGAPPGPPPVAPLPPGPVSFRQLYTLSPEGNAAAFDVTMFQDPEQLLRIVVPVLQSIDEAKLGFAINVRANLP